MFQAFKSLFTESGGRHSRRLTLPRARWRRQCWGDGRAARRHRGLLGILPTLDVLADMSMRLGPPAAPGVRRHQARLRRGGRAHAAAAALAAEVLTSVALLVMKDGGPCLFGHRRIGANGRKFKCLKFRSMVMNADVVLKGAAGRRPVARAEWERDFAARRRAHHRGWAALSAAPASTNCRNCGTWCAGDMSLVGPRPVVENELERYGDAAAYYLRVLPGITGLQVMAAEMRPTTARASRSTWPTRELDVRGRHRDPVQDRRRRPAWPWRVLTQERPSPVRAGRYGRTA